MRIKPARLKKRHNVKGRMQVHESKQNVSSAAHVQLDPSVFATSEYDSANVASSNQLILPSAKNLVKRKLPSEFLEKRLSKRQRRALEKIVDSKKKKEHRSSVLEDLQKYRIDVNELDKLVPVVSLTRGADPKKSGYENNKVDKLTARDHVRIKPLTGSRKKGSEFFREEVSLDKLNLVLSSSEDESTDIETLAKSDNLSKPMAHDSYKNTNCTPANTVKNEPIDIDEPRITTMAASSVSVSPVEVPDRQEKVSLPTAPVRKLKFTQVYRTKEIQESRLKLPILSEEHQIMEAIADNHVVIICGETGSGKTTQVPQFLFEAGYTEFGIIGVTEPRRVAAVAMSRRVAEEMCLANSGKVSYLIRYEGTASPETKIKFMTDGVLLKEVERDFLLNAYSVIVIDEAHERSVFTDILIGLLSRIVRLRAKRGNPLKLIIMSATLRVDDFISNKHLFAETPPVIRIESRQFPVTIHFSRETPSDYMAEAYRKVCQIHREQPAGGILVFVTGQDEVHWLVAKLRSRFDQKNSRKPEKFEKSKRISESRNQRENRKFPAKKAKDEDSGKSLFDKLKVDLDDYSLKSEIEAVDQEGEEDDDVDSSKNGSDIDAGDVEVGDNPQDQPMWILPLYALLSTEQQQLVFEPPPNPDARFCVISTNVGETSLTIPNIRYVVDTGKVKTKLFDKVTGVSTFVVSWASKASAVQRAGRAGRMGPGHCYRLFSTAIFTDEMSQFAEPEITRRPVEDLVLQMKAIGIDRVMNFPFPTPPPIEAVASAEKLLLNLGALSYDDEMASVKKNIDSVARITDLGRLMARLPVSPRFSRVLCSAPDRNSLTYLIAMLSGLSVQELLLTECESGNDVSINGPTIRKARMAWSPPGESRLLGDPGLLLRAIGAAEYSKASPEFCRASGIRIKALLEARKVRRQLTNIVNTLHPSINITVDPQLSPPSDSDCLLLRRLLLGGFGDRVAKRIEDTAGQRVIEGEGKQTINVNKPGGAYAANGIDGTLSIHPSSVLYKEKPSYIMFQDVTESSVGKAGTVYLKIVSAIEPSWLPIMCAAFCNFGEIAEEQAGQSLGPRWDTQNGTIKCHRKTSYGSHNWNLGLAEVDYPAGIDRVRWFARLLLEGKIIAPLEQYVPVLLGAPLSVVKSWGRLQARTEILVRTLLSKNVDNLTSLIAAWREDSKYLLSAYLEWLPQSLHAQAAATWPPIVVPPEAK